MLLKDWLKATGMKPYQMAKAMGIAPTTIYKSMNGQQRLSARYAKEIEDFTGGAVSRTEALWPEDFEEKDKNGGIQGRWIPAPQQQPRIEN